MPLDYQLQLRQLQDAEMQNYGKQKKYPTDMHAARVS